MRHFYLRAEDKVKDYFEGVTPCKHNGLAIAKDCVKCLHELVTAAEQRAVEESINELHSIPGGAPVGCVASQLIGDTVSFAVSVCSLKDGWSKKIARTMAYDRLRKKDTHPRFASYTGSVSAQQKPVKAEVMRQIASNANIPRHARKAAEQWLHRKGL